MEKRTIIALILIFAIFWLSNELIWKRRAPVEPVTEPSVTETIPSEDPYYDDDRVFPDRISPDPAPERITPLR